MSLDLVRPGSLQRPGPIGRFVRLTLGLFCLYALWELFHIAPDFKERPISFLPNLTLMFLVVCCIFNYVVNIGFSKDWHRYPLIVSLVCFTIIALGGVAISGDVNSQLLGYSILIWLAYFFGHLGISFLLAAILATPGCEMRAIPELIGKINGRGSKEHHCPVSILTGIDNWEKNRSS